MRENLGEAGRERAHKVGLLAKELLGLRCQIVHKPIGIKRRIRAA